ncbi:MAG: hypothetical protein ACFE7R_08070 [Candidatus Hodarchaeota archaeon]
MKPDEYYGVNTIPGIAWALDLYLKKGGPFKITKSIEMTFPLGEHKERMQTKGKHEIILWITKKKIYVRSVCTYDKECKINHERVSGKDRESLKELPWEDINDRLFFRAITRWLLRLELDFATLIRALNTICDRKVEIPLKTKYGRVFDKFNDYRTHRWPEDATPDKRSRFLEEVLVRVSFWIQSAAEVGALKA